MIMGRLFFRPALPPALLPTVAIEMAPPTVGSIAYFAINGDRVDSIAAFLAGYAVLMVLAQVRLLPAYLRLTFGPGTWAFAFSSAAVVTTALHWNGLQRPGGYTAYAFILLAAISAFIAWVAARTIQELMRNQFLPHTLTGRSGLRTRVGRPTPVTAGPARPRPAPRNTEGGTGFLRYRLRPAETQVGTTGFEPATP